MSKAPVAPLPGGGADENVLSHLFPEAEVAELTGAEPYGYADYMVIPGEEVREKLVMAPDTGSTGRAAILMMLSYIRAYDGLRYMRLRLFDLSFDAATGEISSVTEAYGESRYPSATVIAGGPNKVLASASAPSSRSSTQYDKTNDRLLLYGVRSSSEALNAVSDWRAKAFLIFQSRDVST